MAGMPPPHGILDPSTATRGCRLHIVNSNLYMALPAGNIQHIPSGPIPKLEAVATIGPVEAVGACGCTQGARLAGRATTHPNHTDHAPRGPERTFVRTFVRMRSRPGDESPDRLASDLARVRDDRRTTGDEVIVRRIRLRAGKDPRRALGLDRPGERRAKVCANDLTRQPEIGRESLRPNERRIRILRGRDLDLDRGILRISHISSSHSFACHRWSIARANGRGDHSIECIQTPYISYVCSYERSFDRRSPIRVIDIPPMGGCRRGFARWRRRAGASEAGSPPTSWLKSEPRMWQKERLSCRVR